jgi:hypothetical protein
MSSTSAVRACLLEDGSKPAGAATSLRRIPQPSGSVKCRCVQGATLLLGSTQCRPARGIASLFVLHVPLQLPQAWLTNVPAGDTLWALPCCRCRNKYQAMVAGRYPPACVQPDLSMEPLCYWLPGMMAPTEPWAADVRKTFCDLILLRQDDAWLDLVRHSTGASAPPARHIRA